MKHFLRGFLVANIIVAPLIGLWCWRVQAHVAACIWFVVSLGAIALVNRVVKSDD